MAKDSELNRKGPVSVNILGSCVSREPFNYLSSRYPLVVKEYIHSMSPLFFDGHDQDWPVLKGYEVNFGHGFLNRSLCTLFNGSTKQKLLNNKGDWIILDDFYFNFKVCEITRSVDGRNETVVTQVGPLSVEELRRIFGSNPRFEGFSIRPLDAIPNYPLLVKNLAAFLKDNWGKNIIIIDAAKTSKKVIAPYVLEDVSTNSEADYYRLFCTKQLLEILDCNFLPLQSELLRKDDNLVHYNIEVYEYVSTVIGETIFKRKGYRLRCQRALADLQLSQSMMIHSESIPLDAITKDIDRIIRQSSVESYDEAISQCIENIRLSKCGQLEKRLSAMYSDELYAGYDLEKSMEWIQRAIGKGCSCKHEYLSILYKRGSEKDLKELYSNAVEGCGYGDYESITWMGKLYHDGIPGVLEADSEKAAD